MSESSGTSQPSQYRPVGIALAISSGVLIGSSFVFKKKGLLISQKGKVAGEGVGYLKSPMWWTGMTIMILGELCNFAAYAFVEAIIVTPMGALSVVICAILSHFILKEKLSLFGWIGSIQCILGASILALNAPEEQSVSTIKEFKRLFLGPGFLAYGSVVIASAVFLAAYAAPRWGHRTMMPYIGVCSLIGGLSVSCTQGLGACILTSIRGENQFKNWFIYFLLIFVIITLLTEVYYLNVALALFNTAMVTPTYYVTFTFCTLVTSIILYQGLKASAVTIMTVVLAFLVICTGITILQMSKVDPRKLTNVDDRTTLLLEAAKQEVEARGSRDTRRLTSVTSRATLNSARRRRCTTSTQDRPTVSSLDHKSIQEGEQPSELFPLYATDEEEDSGEEERAIMERSEEPGMDSLRGTFGAVGTLIRARRRATALSEVKRRASNATGRDSEMSMSTRGDVRANSLSASVKSQLRVLSDAEVQSEKAEKEKELFKILATACGGDAPIARPPPVLRRPSTAPDSQQPGSILGEGMVETPESELTPPVAELRRTSSLHAQFDTNDVASLGAFRLTFSHPT